MAPGTPWGRNLSWTVPISHSNMKLFKNDLAYRWKWLSPYIPKQRLDWFVVRGLSCKCSECRMGFSQRLIKNQNEQSLPGHLLALVALEIVCKLIYSVWMSSIHSLRCLHWNPHSVAQESNLFTPKGCMSQANSGNRYRVEPLNGPMVKLVHFE